jgi:hypothetical protein
MKRLVFFLTAMLFVFSAGAQGNQKQDVIASAGGYNEAGTGLNKISISWTLGETIVSTFEYHNADPSKDFTLTQGFQQPDTVIKIVTELENLDILVNVIVYPNPASELINIQFEAPVDGQVVLVLLDSQGKLLKRDLIESPMVEKQINMQDLPAGIYYLRLTKGKLVNVYKVVKL